jgi:RNA polymerase primary sigma factor
VSAQEQRFGPSPEDGNRILSRYFADMRQRPLLSREEEIRLARGARRGCLASRDRLIEANLSFVVRVAKEYRNMGIPFEDLLNEGNLGLIQAAHRYDPDRGAKFITFAIWWIRKAILEALGDRGSMVRVSLYQRKKIREIRETERALRRQLGRPPRRHEVSEKMSRSLASLDRTLQSGGRTLSLEEKVGREQDRCLADYLVDERSGSPAEFLIREEAARLIREALPRLAPRERRVLSYRYGLEGRPTLVLQEIGRKLSISRERVRQIETQAKRHLLRLIRPHLSSPARRPRPAPRRRRGPAA